MSTKPKQVKKKSSIHPCPYGSGFSLHDEDQHKACPICLGTVHARRALTKPETCVFLPAFNTRKTSDVCGKGPEKTDVEQHDLLLVRSVHSMNPRLVGLTNWSMLMLVLEVLKSLASYSLSCFTIQARSCG